MEKHIFIIRFWSEYREVEHANPELRGTIQHVSSGKKYPLTHFSSIADFIAPYLPDGKRPLLQTPQMMSTQG